MEPHQLERVVNELEVRQLWSSLSLPDLLERHPRRKGAPALRALLAAQGIGLNWTRNDFEAAYLAFLDAHGLPRPVPNTTLMGARGSYESDTAWRDRRIIIELDGRGVHMTTMAFEKDRARDRDLALTGWRTFRVTPRQLVENPAALAEDLRALRAQPVPGEASAGRVA